MIQFLKNLFVTKINKKLVKVKTLRDQNWTIYVDKFSSKFSLFLPIINRVRKKFGIFCDWYKRIKFSSYLVTNCLKKRLKFERKLKRPHHRIEIFVVPYETNYNVYGLNSGLEVYNFIQPIYKTLNRFWPAKHIWLEFFLIFKF